MKKTQLIELLSLVRRTIVPFLSIVLFVAMSITLYAGLTWTGRAIQERIDSALDQSNTNDFTIFSGLGLTDSDINAVSQLQGVSDVEPAYVSYESIRGESNSDSRYAYCYVRSITERINKLDVVEGTLPTQPDEIALLWNSTQFCNYKVGDTITFEADGDNSTQNDGMKSLKNATFTITAIVSSADYLCNTSTSLGINPDGKQITCVFYTAKSAFSPDAFGNSYPIAYVTGDGLISLNPFDDAYETASGDIFASIKQAGKTLSQARYASVRAEADTKISDGQSQLDNASSQINSAETQISDGKQQLATKKTELADAQNELDSKVTEVNSKKQEAQAQLAQAESQIAQAQAQLSQLTEEYNTGKSEVDYYNSMSDSLRSLSDVIQSRFAKLVVEAQSHSSDPNFREWLKNECSDVNADTSEKVAAFKQTYPTRPSELEPLLDGLELDSSDYQKSLTAQENAVGLSIAAEKIQTDVVQPGQKKLAEAAEAISQMSAGIDAAQAQLDANRAEYYAQMASADEQIYYAQSQIASGESQIASGESQLTDGEAQLAEKEAQYSQGQADLNKAKASAESIKNTSWVVSDRNDTYVSQISATTSQTLKGLRLTMALLFIIVGLLVCYSVMSRLVHEHLTQLGTKKALGFTLFETSRQFLSYALFACLLGIFLGSIVGAPIVQLVLIPSMNQYIFESPGPIFQLSDIAMVSLAQIVLICLSAWLACRSILKKNAIELLGGQRPSSATHRFYESWRCWERMGTLAQTMVNNCFNDKRRVFGTLVGVAGCTALIVCAVTLQGGIRNTTVIQESIIERFDQIVYVTNDSSPASIANESDKTNTVDEVIASKNYASLKALYATKGVNLSNGSRTYISLIVPENMDNLSDVMTLKLTQSSNSSDGNELYISSALANYYHYSVGDEFSFGDSDDVECKATITGIFDYYGGTSVAVMSEKAYKQCFGEDPDYTARLVASGKDSAAFSDLVKTAVDFDCIVDSRKLTREISNTVNSLALTVVAIYVGISALVALFVLLNLNIMYVSEKKRELVVMMVNGYEVKDAKRYVSRDTIIMDALGMIIGCALGTAMGVAAIQSLQNNRLAFVVNVNYVAWLIGIAVCALFSFIVMRIALRRVSKFNLTSVND